MTNLADVPAPGELSLLWRACTLICEYEALWGMSGQDCSGRYPSSIEKWVPPRRTKSIKWGCCRAVNSWLSVHIYLGFWLRQHVLMGSSEPTPFLTEKKLHGSYFSLIASRPSYLSPCHHVVVMVMSGAKIFVRLVFGLVWLPMCFVGVSLHALTQKRYFQSEKSSYVRGMVDHSFTYDPLLNA